MKDCRGSSKPAKPRGAMYADCPDCGRRVPVTFGGLLARHEVRS